MVLVVKAGQAVAMVADPNLKAPAPILMVPVEETWLPPSASVPAVRVKVDVITRGLFKVIVCPGQLSVRLFKAFVVPGTV